MLCLCLCLSVSHLLLMPVTWSHGWLYSLSAYVSATPSQLLLRQLLAGLLLQLLPPQRRQARLHIHRRHVSQRDRLWGPPTAAVLRVRLGGRPRPGTALTQHEQHHCGDKHQQNADKQQAVHVRPPLPEERVGEDQSHARHGRADEEDLEEVVAEVVEAGAVSAVRPQYSLLRGGSVTVTVAAAGWWWWRRRRRRWRGWGRRAGADHVWYASWRYQTRVGHAGDRRGWGWRWSGAVPGAGRPGAAGRACAGCWYPEEPLESNVDMVGG